MESFKQRRLLIHIQGSHQTIHDAVFLPEEKVVVTASGDKTVRCWSIDHFLIEEEISEEGSTRSVSVITRTAEEGTEMNNATEC